MNHANQPLLCRTCTKKLHSDVPPAVDGLFVGYCKHNQALAFAQFAHGRVISWDLFGPTDRAGAQQRVAMLNQVFMNKLGDDDPPDKLN